MPAAPGTAGRGDEGGKVMLFMAWDSGKGGESASHELTNRAAARGGDGVVHGLTPMGALRFLLRFPAFSSSFFFF